MTNKGLRYRVPITRTYRRSAQPEAKSRMIQTRLRLCLYLVMFITEATIICLASSVLAQNLGGQITRLEGTADVRLPGAAPTSAKLNMPIEYHEQLSTHYCSRSHRLAEHRVCVLDV
jgi:hypothetical protein